MTFLENNIGEELKARVADGNEEAFKELLDHYQPRLYGYVFRLVKSKEIAEELVMDVFLKLWLAREMVPQIEKMDGFLFRIAFNKTMDFFRAAADDKKLVDLIYEQIDALTQAADAHTILVSKEYEERLRSVIDLLPERRRHIFELSRESGLSHEEIAETLGISKSTVANTITAAKEFIRTNLLKVIIIILMMTR